MFNYRQLDDDRLEYVTIASTDEIRNGERLILDVAGNLIAVFNIAGRYYAIADICSHDDGPVAEGEIDGQEIECPRHGARFDLETGQALTLPAVVDIPAYPVRVEGDEIRIGIPIIS